jgi:hypothetical protein
MIRSVLPQCIYSHGIPCNDVPFQAGDLQTLGTPYGELGQYGKAGINH